MTAVLPYIILIVSFFFLVKGADFFVEGSASIAKKLRIPDIIVGLTIVAMGTSAPELAVSVTASLSGSNDISIGNVVGSNLFNILFVLGLSAVILPITVDRSMFKRDFPMLMITAAGLPLIALLSGNKIGVIGGIILLILFVLYIFLAVRSALAYRKEHPEEQGEEIKVLSWWRSILYVSGGLAAIIISGNFVVDSATQIARQLGLSEAIIGLTIVAIGTSLPELVTSAVAAKKGNSDIAIGNVVGSNIFNVLLILGTTAVITPFSVSIESFADQIVLLGISILLLIFSRLGYKIGRGKGIIFLLLYVAYTVFIFLR